MVEEDVPVDRDPPAIRPDETRQGVHQRRLAGAGRPEEGHVPSVAREARVERERAQPQADVHFQRHGDVTRLPTARARNSEVRRARAEMAIATRERRIAPASPPGTWVKV